MWTTAGCVGNEVQSSQRPRDVVQETSKTDEYSSFYRSTSTETQFVAVLDDGHQDTVKRSLTPNSPKIEVVVGDQIQ